MYIGYTQGTDKASEQIGPPDFQYKSSILPTVLMEKVTLASVSRNIFYQWCYKVSSRMFFQSCGTRAQA